MGIKRGEKSWVCGVATVMARYSVLKYRGFKSCAAIQCHLGAPVLLFFFFFFFFFDEHFWDPEVA